MAKRDDLIKVYIAALDACTVMILGEPNGPAILATGRLTSEIVFDTLWFARQQHAELVLAQCPEGWVNLPPDALRDEVVNAAAALGASFRTTAEVEAEAKRTVAQIMENVERARIRGELRRMNADYKLYRQNELSLGRKPVGYGEHLANFTRSLVVLAATNTNALRRVEQSASAIGDIPKRGHSGWDRKNKFTPRRAESIPE